MTRRANAAPPRYVIYHADCRDGFAAAWAARLALGHATPEGGAVHYIPAHYGDPPPETDPQGSVHILDFSYSLETMRYLIARHQGRVTLLDHHRTAQEELEGRIPGAVFDLLRSGAVMAWRHFHPGAEVPEVLLYVQDRDLWQWQLPNSRKINEALQQTPLEFEVWDRLSVPRLLEEGARLRAAALELVQANIDRAGVSEVLGTAVPSVEAEHHTSETAERLLELHPDAPFAAVYWHTERNGVPATKFSLRSRKGSTDVSQIARLLGGGGHASAAGFVLVQGQPMPGRRDLHPSDTRHYSTAELLEMARRPPELRTPGEQALADKMSALQLAADENSLYFHGQAQDAGQLWQTHGHRQMLAAHRTASAFPAELPVPSVQLHPDRLVSDALKRAHYPGAHTFPQTEEHCENARPAHRDPDKP